MKTVKTLQLSAYLAKQADAELMDMVAEVRELLWSALSVGRLDRVVQFSVEVEHENGGSTKLQYARRDP